MIADDRERLEQRVLILAPTGKDAALAASELARAGVASESCADMNEVCEALETGAAAVLLAEEAVTEDGARRLSQCLSSQPTWSDLPVVVLARPGADSAAVMQAMNLFGNVTVMERPLRVSALISVVRSALRARLRQYQTREHLAERERTGEALRESQTTLQEADRRKDEFLAILAHELRNPLAPIRNSLHILRRTAGSDTSAARVAEMMDRQVDHMVRLVDDLLEVSRITRGKITLRKEPVDLGAVVRSALDTSRPLIEAAGHQLTLAIPPGPLIVDADPMRLAQVFANLMNNAAKYTKARGQIWITIRSEDDVAAISVRDTGVGISHDMLPRVFDLFAQVDRDASGGTGGLGIGLTLVKSLVEMHDGRVEARSEGFGRGSEFVVYLPLAVAERPAHPRKTPDEPSTVLAPQRVMVVDDNRDAAESLGMLLQLLGADVHVEYSGAGALDAIATHQPAVILLDIGMPGLSGLDVARHIRSQPELSHLKLIALTGWGQEEDRRRSELAGFDCHLIKPVDLEALEKLLMSYS